MTSFDQHRRYGLTGVYRKNVFSAKIALMIHHLCLVNIVHVMMAWCHHVASHYLNQLWQRSPRPYGVTRPQWVKYLDIVMADINAHDSTAFHPICNFQCWLTQVLIIDISSFPIISPNVVRCFLLPLSVCSKAFNDKIHQSSFKIFYFNSHSSIKSKTL